MAEIYIKPNENGGLTYAWLQANAKPAEFKMTLTDAGKEKFSYTGSEFTYTVSGVIEKVQVVTPQENPVKHWRSIYRRPLRRLAGWLAGLLLVVQIRLSCYDRGHRFDGCAACSECDKPMADEDPNFYDRDR